MAVLVSLVCCFEPSRQSGPRDPSRQHGAVKGCRGSQGGAQGHCAKVAEEQRPLGKACGGHRPGSARLRPVQETSWPGKQDGRLPSEPRAPRCRGRKAQNSSCPPPAPCPLPGPCLPFSGLRPPAGARRWEPPPASLLPPGFPRTPACRREKQRLREGKWVPVGSQQCAGGCSVKELPAPGPGCFQDRGSGKKEPPLGVFSPPGQAAI